MKNKFIIKSKATGEIVNTLLGGKKTPESVLAAAGYNPAQFECFIEEIVIPNIKPEDKLEKKLKGPLREAKGHLEVDEMGYFGNVWIRKLYFPKRETIHDGHTHNHDHVSLLATGSVLVEVEGETPTKFTAPTFIVIHAEKEHKITALQDDTLWFCIFAMKDENMDLVDHFANNNSPIKEIQGQTALHQRVLNKRDAEANPKK